MIDSIISGVPFVSAERTIDKFIQFIQPLHIKFRFDWSISEHVVIEGFSSVDHPFDQEHALFFHGNQDGGDD